jgi:hypothetical protein
MVGGDGKTGGYGMSIVGQWEHPNYAMSTNTYRQKR